VDAGDGKTFSISGGADQALFAINATTGTLTFLSAPNFEAPADAGANNVYDVQVTVTDTAGLSDVQDLAVTVTNTNEAPVITSNAGGATASLNAAENQAAVTTVTSTDVDAGDGKTFSLSGGADQALFAINATTGALTFQSAPDFEAPADAGANNVYDVQVTVTDTAGLTDVQDLAVTVTDANEAPVITSNAGGATAALNAAENQAAVTTVTSTDVDAGDDKTFSISGGADQALFAINATTGALTFQSAPNFEAPADAGSNNVYDVQVTVTDTAGLTDVQDLAVTVTNANEAPVITSNAGGATAALSAAENQTAVTTVTSTDVDAGDGKSFSLTGGADQTLFAINGTTGALTFLSAPNFEAPADAGANNVYDVQVTVTDTAGLTDVQDLAVTVTNANEAPVITSNAGGATAALNAAENQTAVTTVTSTDVDAGDGKTFSLTGGVDQALFSIDGTTGALTFQSAPDFEAPADAGADNVYDVQVTVTDTAGLTDVQDLAVTVTNINESVVVDSTGAWLDLNANGMLDAEDTTEADFTAGTGNIDLTANPITIHFNDIPDTPLDLTGFTSDDKIEIDIPAFNEARMRTSPAHSFDSLSTSTNAVYLGLDNQGYYSVFLAPKTLPSSADNQGALAFYTSNIRYLAYWNDLSNPLGNMSNILPSDTLSALNLGAGHGVLIDFIWTPATSFPETGVVVESTGAWIDTNADGVHDANEITPWVGGSDNLAGHQVTIHFNSVPNQPLDLTGFGSDDLIEIDAQAFINNGHNALNILTRPNILKTDEFSVPGTLTTTSNRLSNSGYSFANWYTTSNGSTTSARVGLFNSSSSLYFTSNNGSRFTGYQLATGISTNLPLQQMVNFVNFPESPATVHVVVEREGAVIDYDGDGVRDSGENRLAVFGAGGNADLATGLTPVIIHFNDAPYNALDLTGFGSDDKIELDIQAMQQNIFLNTRPATAESIGSTGIFSGEFYYYLQSHFGNTFTYMEHPIHVGQSSFVTAGYRGGTPPSGAYGLFMHSLPAVSSRTGGYIAYWTDAGNALNNLNNLLPGYTGANTAAVLATLNSNAPHAGLIDFVWTINVVVDDQAGNVATFIDANGNGVRDGGEDTLALLGQTQADVDAFNAAAGTAYGSQVVDLASEQVAIHYNDLPTGDWMPNLTGFDGNDRIEIDVAAMRNDSDTLDLNNQTIQTTSSSQTQVYAGVSGVSSGSTAVYISGGNLKFGHRTTTTSILGSSTVFNTYYTATGALEGVIASNAGALANHFQQVVFVMTPVIE